MEDLFQSTVVYLQAFPFLFFFFIFFYSGISFVLIS